MAPSVSTLLGLIGAACIFWPPLGSDSSTTGYAVLFTGWSLLVLGAAAGSAAGSVAGPASDR